MTQIADFVTHAPVPPEIIDEYRGRVPDELVEIWETYGYGSFSGGFLRVIDPKLYEEAVGYCIGHTQGDRVAVPIMVTGLGDLITWESGQTVVAIQYRRGHTYGMGGSVDTVVKLAPYGVYIERMKAEIFAEAVATHGELQHDESFFFVPPLSLGGKPKLENMKKRRTISAIQAMVGLQGIIGH